MYQVIKTKFSIIKEASKNRIHDENAVLALCKDMATMAQESLQIITLNAKNFMIDRHLITLGLVNQSLVHMREVLKPCILDSAVSFIAVHNHPSGDLTPSVEDIKITRKLIEASKIVEIPILDHVIIGRRDSKDYCLSMNEKGICQF